METLQIIGAVVLVAALFLGPTWVRWSFMADLPHNAARKRFKVRGGVEAGTNAPTVSNRSATPVS